MGATLEEAKKLAEFIRARFSYSVEVDENCDERDQFYPSLIADFGTEIELGPFCRRVGIGRVGKIKICAPC